MILDVPAVDDPRLQIRIPIPVKGRKQPLIVTVPRYDFIDDAVFADIAAASDTIVADNKDKPVRTIQKLVDLSMLKPFVSDKDYAVLETLPPGQLQAVMLVWTEKSGITLGELLASAPSSTGTTEAPSSTTSTSAATPVPISGAA